MPHVFTKGHHQSGQQSDLHPNFGRPNFNPIKTLLEWKAPARPFRKKDPSYYRTVTILIVLLMLVTFLWLQEVILIGVLLALGFVIYVLGFVPPEEVNYRISTQGVTIGDHFYFWQDLDSFYFTQKEGSNLLHILTRLRFPGELMVLIGDLNEDKVKEVVAEYLPFHEIMPTSFIQKWAERLETLFPLETHH